MAGATISPHPVLAVQPATDYLAATRWRYLAEYGARSNAADQAMAEHLAALLAASRAEDAETLLADAQAFCEGPHPHPTSRLYAARLAGRLFRLAVHEGELPSRAEAQLVRLTERRLEASPDHARDDLRRWIEYRRRQGRRQRQLEVEARVLCGLETVAAAAPGLEREALVIRWQQSLVPAAGRRLGRSEIAQRTRLVRRYLRFTRRS